MEYVCKNMCVGICVKEYVLEYVCWIMCVGICVLE